MSIELVLAGIIVVLIGLLGFREQENKRERDKLTNALVSKNTQEFQQLETRREQPKQETKPVLDPFTTTQNMTQEEFDEMIKNQLEEVN